MKVSTAISKIFKIAVWTVMSLLLLVAAVLLLVYAPWSQDNIRRYAQDMLARQGISISIDAFSLRFPLDIRAEGLAVAMPDGMGIKADTLALDVEAYPLLAGMVRTPEILLDNAKITIGSPDTTMYLTIKGDRLRLSDTSVGIAGMDIDIDRAVLKGGRVAMTISQDSIAADTAATPPSAMTVKVGSLVLDDFAFDMAMLPVIDNLHAAIPAGTASGVAVDLLKQTIDIRSFTGRRLDARYVAPDSATVAAYPVVEPQTSDSVAPWTIAIDTIGFSDSKALYAVAGAQPLPGLDFNYISVDSVCLGIKNFYNRASVVRLPLQISATERCGVSLTASGKLDISETALNFDSFEVATPRGTQLAFEGTLGSGDMTADPSLPMALTLDGRLMPADAALMFPAFAPFLDAMGPDGGIYATVDLDGTAGNLAISDISLLVNGMARLKASGHVVNAFNPAEIGGDIALEGAIINLETLKPAIFDKSTAKEIMLPATTLAGHVAMNRGDIDGKLKATTHGGTLSLDAIWKQRAEDYKIDLTAKEFPVEAFMPLLGLRQLSLSLSADGHGYNPFSRAMRLDADIDIEHAFYNGYDYKGLGATAHIADGEASVKVDGNNPNANFDLDASGNLDGDTYRWTAALDGRRIDLKALRLMPTDAVVTASMSAEATISPKAHLIDGHVKLGSLNYTTGISSISVSDVLADFLANDSSTTVGITNRDLRARLESPMMLDSIMERLARVGAIVDYEMKNYTVDVDTVQRVLPPFTLRLAAGPDNAINSVLAANKTSFDTLSVNIANDSTLRMNARLLSLSTASVRLDTVSLRTWQQNGLMLLKANVENRPGTFDEWAHVKLAGALGQNALGLELTQADIRGKEGYHVGAYTTLADSVVRLTLKPANPTIAYMPWTVNEGNYITWNIPHRHLDADLRMHSATSSLAIYTNHVDGHEDDEQLVVNISDIHIADWIKINPFAPQMTGDLSADIRIEEHDNALNGSGFVNLADFTYNRQRVGTFRADLDLSTDLSGRINADVSMDIDGQKALSVRGALNDSTAGSPLLMDLVVTRLPLEIANPFVGADVASLRGSLKGKMDIHGEMAAPRLDGWLAFDSAAVKVAMIGAWYDFNNVKIPVDSNIVKFNDFSLISLNRNPLAVNGRVDLNSFSNPSVDLSMAGTNLQIVNNNKRAKGANVYGRGFVTVGANVKGNMDFMAIDANLSLLSGSNVSYVVSDAETLVAQQQDEGLVTFVNFADTAAVQQADSLVQSSTAILLEASLTVQNGATVNVDLSPTTRDRVSLQPNGTLDFSMKPFAEPRLTGRLNIPKGFVRYTPPFMSEKNFTFQENSYVAFNGNMLNPILSVHAVDRVKANVTQSGQNSRLVNFDIALNVTGTLENMDVSFDLSTDDDVTVANELQTMSASQRANQAMNMLLYNIYSGPGTRGNSNISGNAVYSFLTSQLNNWAANNIKGVDLSFGVDQYDRTYGGSTSQTTSYSYQVSKSLFNDRFKIVVGGNYSTDANADENLSENLIKDISFEYYLNKAQTMYLRLFRHTGYESILEGEITRTGVGFVYKRKSPSFRGLFLRRYRRRQSPAESQASSLPDSSIPKASEK